jgi:hypothetical protein
MGAREPDHKGQSSAAGLTRMPIHACEVDGYVDGLQGPVRSDTLAACAHALSRRQHTSSWGASPIKAAT